MVGTWKGKYRYHFKKGVEFNNQEVEFIIEIKEFDGKKFSGTVQDLDEYFGTKGTGIIEGKIDGNTIDFIKQMPVKTLVLNHKKRVEDSGKKHRPIYYSGISDHENSFSGTWKIKGGISFFNKQLYLSLPTKGFWEMSKQ